MKHFRKSILAAALSVAFLSVHGVAQADDSSPQSGQQDTGTASTGNTDTSGDNPGDKGGDKGVDNGGDKGGDKGGNANDANTVPEPDSLALVALALAGLAALPRRDPALQPSAAPGD